MKIRRFLIASIVALPCASAGAGATNDDLTSVPSANPKSVGVTVPDGPVPRARAGRRARRARRRWRIRRRPSSTTAISTTSRTCVPSLGSNVEATQDRARQEHVPRAARPDRRRPGLRLRDPLPVPGPRGGIAGRHHPRQPGRRRRPSRHGAREHRAGRDNTPAHHRRIDLVSMGGAPALQPGRATAARAAASGRPPSDYPAMVENLLGVLGRGRLRRHPGRLRRQHLDRRRTSAAPRSPALGCPTASSSGLLPRNRFDLTQGGKLQALQVTSNGDGPAHRLPDARAR